MPASDVPARRARDLHPGRLIARSFVRRVAKAREEGRPAIGGWRRRALLGAIFRLMPRQIDRRRAQGLDAVVEWRVRDGEGGVDLWTLRLQDGRASVRRGGAERPRTRIELSTGDFLALAAGQADGVELFLDKRVEIEGDLMFAPQLASLFRVPRRRRPTA